MARSSGAGTTLCFYFAGTSRVAEEVGVDGATKTLYLNDSARRQLAEKKAGAWRWLLRDADGSVATRLTDDGSVANSSAYDPYGPPDAGGSGIAIGEVPETETELGYQATPTDEVSGNLLLGVRQYDPTTQRFTSADTLVAPAADPALATSLRLPLRHRQPHWRPRINDHATDRFTTTSSSERLFNC